jgi:hypothetical protein
MDRSTLMLKLDDAYVIADADHLTCYFLYAYGHGSLPSTAWLAGRNCKWALIARQLIKPPGPRIATNLLDNAPGPDPVSGNIWDVNQCMVHATAELHPRRVARANQIA